LTAKTIEEVCEREKMTGKLDILIGTMIEIPRAALTADEVAEHADFFSFGTNDLTQMTFGFSRDDVNSFLPDYLKQESCTSIRSSRWTRRASASWSRWASRRAARPART
jgi:pyruvate, orthophosphate dikinase